MKETTNEKLSILIIIVLLIGVITIPKFFNKERKIEISNNKTNRTQFAMYKQKSDKSGYDKIDTGTFPSGYKLNTSLSHCEDNNNNNVDISSILSYSDGKAEVTSNKTIMCTLYLDEINSFSKILAAKAAESTPLVQEYKGTGWVDGDSSEKFFDNHIYYWYATNSTNATTIRDSWNIVFAGHCWQIIRTTENGGVKLLYNGEPEIGESNGEMTYDCSDSRGYHLGNVESVLINFAPGSKILGDSYTVSTSGTTTTFTIANNDGTTPSSIVLDSSNASSAIGKYICGTGTTTTCTNNSLGKIVGIRNSVDAVVYKSTSYSDIGRLNSFSGPLSIVGYMYNDAHNTKEYDIGYNQTVLDSFQTVTINSSSLGYYYSDSYLTGTNAYSGCSYTNIEGENNCYALGGTPELGSFIVDPTSSGTQDYSKLVGKYTMKSANSSAGSTGQTLHLQTFYVIGYSGSTLYLIKVDKNHLLSYYQMTLNLSQTYENGSLQNSIQVKNFVTPTELQFDSTSWQNIWPLTYTSYGYNNYYVCINGSDTCSPLFINMATKSYFEYFNPADIFNFSNSFSYSPSSGEYTLDMTDSNAISTFNLQNNDFLKRAHYVCLDANKTLVPNQITCANIGYVFETYNNIGNNYVYGYIALSGGKYVSTNVNNTQEFKNSNNVLYNMLYDNSISSEFKEIIDAWYETNLLNLPEKALIDSEEIYCNDRTTTNSYGGWNLNADFLVGALFGGLGSKKVKINGSNVVVYNLSCPNKTDAFSKTETTNGNGKLTYPIAMISYPELMNLGYDTVRKAGGVTVTMSPKTYRADSVHYQIMKAFKANGSADTTTVNIRPSIALKGNVEPSRGTGTMTDPYVVEVSNS